MPIPIPCDSHGGPPQLLGGERHEAGGDYRCLPFPPKEPCHHHERSRHARRLLRGSVLQQGNVSGFEVKRGFLVQMLILNA